VQEIIQNNYLIKGNVVYSAQAQIKVKSSASARPKLFSCRERPSLRVLTVSRGENFKGISRSPTQ
jgi:hypothetical protein